MLVYEIYPPSESGDRQRILLSLKVDGPNQFVAIEDISPEKSINNYSLLSKLDAGFGAFGHRFDRNHTSAIDLNYALGQLARKEGWAIATLEGEELFANGYDPGIPDGAMT